MKVGDLLMRLVCVEEGEWEPVIIVDSAVQTGGQDLLIVNHTGQCWVDTDDLATVEDYEEMIG